MKPDVLLVDDDASMCEFLEEAMRREGLSAASVQTGAEALTYLELHDPVVLVTDLNMPGMTGIELCERAALTRPGLPVIVLTAFGSLETAVSAIRSGAYDFVTKPVEDAALALAIRRAAEHRRMGEELRRLRRRVEASERFEGLVGESPPMQRLYDLLPRAAVSDMPVLVTGETGTGKELVAKALHRRSARSAGPFVAVNCSALPEALLESELFGHVRGAFTDARSDRKGVFQQAEAGTLFLDEIGELPLLLQPKLLRALQEGHIRPVGGEREVAIDVRVIAATNRDLRAEAEAGRFRLDLYYRLNVIGIEVPPLCTRATDILLLAQHFLESAARRTGRAVQGLSTPAAVRLLAHPWPGNVRELQNCIDRAVALTDHDRLLPCDLPAAIGGPPGSHEAPTAYRAGLLPMEEVERLHVLHVLDAVDGNKSAAAAVLGFDRRTLYRKLQRYGMGTE